MFGLATIATKMDSLEDTSYGRCLYFLISYSITVLKYNSEQGTVDKFSNLNKIGFPVTCLKVVFLQFSSATV